MTENRLAQSTSPYLQQHKDNPVDWHPWGPEAFALARREDRPILLSVGYAACHWCHVMAHESFEDEAVAALMNRLFVNIKVDREERPDVDSIYQSALALLTQQPGGWPLTMFLTPKAEPFWGGTYFPPDARYGRPGFASVLQRIAEDAALRKSKHPLEYASCGSYFKNPSRELPAAQLIEDAGLKGLRVGHAHVSDKHANFLVAEPGATADDITTLAAEVVRRVYEQSGYELSEEVRRLGFA